ncbi:MAG: family 78 glycoside hydrolase catalytic domain [Mangrovibacterium sp.]
MGQHIAGWVKFKTSGSEGQVITLDFDENLNQDGTITKKSSNSHTWGRYQVGELILSGKGSDGF